ncbi:MAG: glycosyl hydrolase [Patescibacteria group bacterium]|nr:glycosyl hydrolase [Patescibacteria group bacterium]
MKEIKTKILVYIFLTLLSFPFLFFSFQYFSKASSIKANIIVDIKKTSGPFPDRWKALAQGGEDPNPQFFENVVNQIAELYPKYIRVDHIYDFYDVFSYDSNNNIKLNFDKLDQVVCRIYQAGAKPFFSLGYMPSSLSEDGSLIGKPKKWSDWSYLVKKTIERYSGKNTVLPCGINYSYWRSDIYYEVWNEPDLETFGKWHYSGNKNYLELYFYSIKGAQNALDVFPFKIGGPATTALYKNWIQKFLDYIISNNLRIDFLSWHHYSKKTNDYIDDIVKLNKWLTENPKYYQYVNLPKIISEWGYDSEKNPIADTEVGAAHTLASIKNFISANIEAAFLFEIKDGPHGSSWGILDYQGNKKPRWYALQMLNNLEGNRIMVDGEGMFVSALASINENKIRLILTNYDINNKNIEAVPVKFVNLDGKKYNLTKKYLDGKKEIQLNINPINGEINLKQEKSILMTPNQIVLLELERTE